MNRSSILHPSAFILGFGCLTGLEPATSGSTVQCTAIVLQAPCSYLVQSVHDSIMDPPVEQDS